MRPPEFQPDIRLCNADTFFTVSALDHSLTFQNLGCSFEPQEPLVIGLRLKLA